MAGSQDKILWSLSLEGAEDVSKKLKAAGDVGDEQAKRLKQSFGDVGTGSSGSHGKGLLADGAETGESGAHRLREAIHVLHPVLDEAGLGLGNLGAFARLAGAGMGALGAAIAGSLLIGLAKIGEESDKAGLRLKALGVSGDTFENLKQQAKELGISTENLFPSLEKFAASKNKINADRSSGLTRLRPNGDTEADQAAAGVRILGRGGQETGAQVPDRVFLGAQKALIEGAQGEKISGDEAGKIADAFASKLLENRKLTPEAIDTLNPANQNNLAKSLSSFFGTDLSNGAELKERLARPGQQAPSDREVFRSLNDEAEPAARAQAEAARGVTAAFDALIASTKHLAEAFSGDIGFASALEKLAKLIDGVADNADKLIHPRDYEPGGSKFIGPVRPEDRPGPAPKSLGEVYSGKDGDLLGRLVGYLRGGETSGLGGSAKGNPFGLVTDFAKKAATEPGSLQEKTRLVSPAPSQPEPVPPGYDRASHGTLIRNSEPINATPPEPLPATNGPRSEALPAQQPQQSGTLESLLSGLTAAISNLKPQENLNQTAPANNLGIRGEAQPPGNAAASSQIAELGAAAESAAAKLRGVEAPAATEPQVAHAATGGHIRGPGTSTSDSIPAVLSDGEYVLRTEAVKRVGVDNLDAVNNGSAHLSAGGKVHRYADGGSVAGNETDDGDIDPLTGRKKKKKKKGSGGEGGLTEAVPGGGDQAVIDSLNEYSQAEGERDPDFIPITLTNGYAAGGRVKASKIAGSGIVAAFANGGLVGASIRHFAKGGSAGAAATFADRISAMGLGSIDVPHLAIGGMPEMPMADLSKSELKGGGPNGLDLKHFGTTDLRTDHGDHRVIAHEDSLRALTASAQKAKRFSTGSKPSWYGGGGR